MTMQLHKAERAKAKLRLGLSGVAGSGKTLSALRLARGITTWDKIAVIDTENGSADLYSEKGSYNVITLTEPFTPERYIEAIRSCEQAGMEVIIIDSISHEWEGKGGLLESNELTAQAKFRGNTWSAWSVTAPRHQKFIQAILNSNCHVITTARSKTETYMDPDTKKVKKVGTKEITREGFEYEMTVHLHIDRDAHLAVAMKDRTELFIDTDPFLITEEVGKKILDWCNKGIDAPVPRKTPAEVAQKPKSEGSNLQLLKAELAKRGASDAPSAIAILAEATGQTIENFEISDEEAYLLLGRLMLGVNKKA